MSLDTLSCSSCGSPVESHGKFCKSCGAAAPARDAAETSTAPVASATIGDRPAEPPPTLPQVPMPEVPRGTPADTTIPHLAEVKTLLVLSGTLLVLMLMHWYTATLEGTSSLDASAFKGLEFGRFFLLAGALTVGGCAWALLAQGKRLLNARSAVSDLGHLAFSVGALSTLYLLIRVAAPPRYFRVTNYFDSSPFSDQGSVHPDIAVHAPAILALLTAAGWGVIGLRLAVAGPDGFSLTRCWEVLRDVRALTTGRASA